MLFPGIPATTILFAVGIFGSSVFFSPLRHQPGILNPALHLPCNFLDAPGSWAEVWNAKLHMDHWAIKPIGFHGMEDLYTYILLKYMVNVGKIFHTMDPMGKKKTCSSIITLQILCDACRRKLQKLMLARNFSPPEANVSQDIVRSWRSWRVGLR